MKTRSSAKMPNPSAEGPGSALEAAPASPGDRSRNAPRRRPAPKRAVKDSQSSDSSPLSSPPSTGDSRTAQAVADSTKADADDNIVVAAAAHGLDTESSDAKPGDPKTTEGARYGLRDSAKSPRKTRKRSSSPSQEEIDRPSKRPKSSLQAKNKRASINGDDSLPSSFEPTDGGEAKAATVARKHLERSSSDVEGEQNAPKKLRKQSSDPSEPTVSHDMTKPAASTKKRTEESEMGKGSAQSQPDKRLKQKKSSEKPNTSPPKPSKQPVKGKKNAKGTQTKTGNVITDTDSELSELGPTPDPPSPIRRAIEGEKREIECRCEGWCTCPKHSSYPRPAPKHLSFWALSKAETEAPVSAVRSTVHLPRTTGNVYPDVETGRMVVAAAEVLAQLEHPEAKKTDMRKTRKAMTLMRNVAACFPFEEGPPGMESAVGRMLDALKLWQDNRLYERLWVGVDEAVNGNPDLLLEFQELLPKERQRAGMSELWQKRIRKLSWEKQSEERADTPFKEAKQT